MKKIITCDANEACAKTSYMFTELAGIYPITPSSPMAEHIDEWSNLGFTNIFNDKVKVVEMQSEAGAIGLIHGSLQNGVLSTTFTASQGLLLMIPNMYKIAGEMLPCVMHVAARSLSTHALSILGDHQDIYATRQTGFCMLASSSVQDASFLSGVAHLAAIESSLPFMHFFDGFRTSHEINKIEVLEKEDYLKLLNKDALDKFRARAINPKSPTTRGTAEGDDIYFQATEVRNKFYNDVPDIVNKYMESINRLALTNYKPFNYYGDKDAKKVIVAMGSVCETIKEVIDALDEKLGLIEVHLYRPFSKSYLLDVLPNTVEKIAVLDRTKEFGSTGEPLYLDVVEVLKDKNITIVGGRYGLSSKNTAPKDIKAVFDMLDNPKNNFTIGIVDDVTNLSLTREQFNIKTSKEILIYGYGSDGMVSASKSIIKLIGDNKNDYVQGYFQYDSKKSGGVTVSHLRISENKIRSTYYIEKPDIVVVSKDTYFSEFEILNDIAKNSIMLVNTSKTDKDLVSTFSPKLKKLLKENNTKVYTLNAYDIASKVGLKGKISMIMESAILYISNLIDYKFAKGELIKYIKDKFSKKGDEVVKANIEALSAVESLIKELKIDFNIEPIEVKKNNFLETMFKREGNSLEVSKFLPSPNGVFKGGTTRLEDKYISEIVPHYISENCINCGFCSFVCPHSVIRQFLLSKEEYESSPDYIKNRCKKAIGLDDYYFTVAVSIKNCTGCGLCINTCPGLKNSKALIFNSLSDEIKSMEQEAFDYLDKNIKNKHKFNELTVKGIGFERPKFEYSGACAGCGETTYIKILTQLFCDNLVIANATGCSSIYGGSAPETPYTTSWASSLFEDNAEYGYGMLISNNLIRNRIKNIMENNMDNENKDLFKKWLDNYDDYDITNEVYNNLTNNLPDELKPLKEYIPSKSIWCIGGDGWAYDIGYGGIDHVLSSNDNINILVLDTEVYSNTGGQASKASNIGSIASFATSGKVTDKKDLARMCMSYKNVYVAQISLGANMMQVIKTLKEANDYNGPSIVIAYAPCISHGIKGGMGCSVSLEKLATECGYYPIFRRHPINGFTLDSKNVDFNKYEEFLNSQTRYSMLGKVNKENAKELLEENKKCAIERFEYYKSLENKTM